jgi:hypothetical protein
MALGGKNAVLVQLKQPYKGREFWLFGSKKAIYDHLPAELLGIGLVTLQNRNIDHKPYENQLCIIRKLELLRTPHMRKNSID